MPVVLVGYPASAVPTVWAVAAPFLARGLVADGDRRGLADLYEGLLARDLQLWGAMRDDGVLVAAMVTEIIVYPQAKCCLLMVAGGRDFATWADLLAEIEQWAVFQGCDHTEIVGRRGWERLLAKRGYRPQAVMLRKEIGS